MGRISGSSQWAAIDFKQLSSLVAVVERGSLTKAARALGYSQSAISYQLTTLEGIVGEQLLLRQRGGRRPAALTPAGEVLLEHARILLSQLGDAYAEVRREPGNPRSTIRVASPSFAAVHFIPPLQRLVPPELDAHVELVERRTPEEVFLSLDRGEAEFGFAPLPVPVRFAAEEIGSDPYVALSAHGELFDRTDISVAELASRPLVGLRHGPHDEIVEAFLASGGIDTRLIVRHDDSRLVEAQVAAANAIAVVPSLSLALGDSSIRVLRFRTPPPPLTFGLIHLGDRTRGEREMFRKMALDVCRRTIEEACARRRVVALGS